MRPVFLFGATGYQGGLTARALLARGIVPTLVGRSEAYLKALSIELGDLPYAVADARDEASLRRILSPGDVLLTTVGPFHGRGEATLRAAIDQGAHYVDSCGESVFYKTLHHGYRDAVVAAGITALSACAYDFFPGNALGDHVLQAAGPAAVRLELGYLGSVARGYRMSAGTLASGTASLLERGLFFRGGRFVEEAFGQRFGRVALAGRAHPGLSIAGTEALFLPALHPNLRDIDAFWCWGGKQTRAMHATLRALSGLGRLPRARQALELLFSQTSQGDGTGPSARLRERSSAHVVARAFAADGRCLAAAEMGDIDGFTFTANILAWTAERLARGEMRCAGFTGPVQAFGREALIAGHAECGMVVRALPVPDGSAVAAAGGPAQARSEQARTAVQPEEKLDARG